MCVCVCVCVCARGRAWARVRVCVIPVALSVGHCPGKTGVLGSNPARGSFFCNIGAWQWLELTTHHTPASRCGVSTQPAGAGERCSKKDPRMCDPQEPNQQGTVPERQWCWVRIPLLDPSFATSSPWVPWLPWSP